MAGIDLSNISPSFSELDAQLTAAIQSGSAAQVWKALLATSTGSILMEALASIGENDQKGIQNAFLEAFPDTAKLDSSLRGIARTLGVRLTRYSSASTTLTLTRVNTTQSLTIDPYSVFTAPNATLFNRDAIVFGVGVASVTVTLYEGVVTTYSSTGDGSSSQSLVVYDYPDFVVEDSDVVVSVGGTPLTIVTDGLWHYPNLGTTSSNVVQDRTLPTGELQLIFGNTLFGYVPPNGAAIDVQFIVSQGSGGNNPNFAGSQVVYSQDNTITGTATNSLQGGLDETSASSYRLSPLSYASYDRAVSLPDHTAIAKGYPGIADTQFLGQRSYAPSLLQYMNVVRVYILNTDGTQPNATDFANFLTWFEPKASPFTYVQMQAVAKQVDVTATVYILSSTDQSVVKSEVETAIQSLFAPRYGTLGRSLYISDIYNTIRQADPSIDYVQLTSPTADIIGTIEVPGNVTLVGDSAAGSLTAGTTYTYSVSALDSQGNETFGSAAVDLVLPTGDTEITISWPAVPGASGYRVYGRTSGSLVQLTPDLPATTTSYVDTGAAANPGTAINQLSSVNLYYAALNNLNITVKFTDRAVSTVSN